MRYPWYEVVDGGELAQGDILCGCPIVQPTQDLRYAMPSDEIEVDIGKFDLVLMTQCCDLATEKVADVILCPHWDIISAAGGPSRIRLPPRCCLENAAHGTPAFARPWHYC